jgi:hypothetical protein
MNVLRILLIASVVVAVQPVHGHGRYPRDCCSDHDCRPVIAGEVEVLADGRYLIVPTGETFTRSQVRPSFDAGFHRCLYDPSKLVTRTLCLLVPAGI